MMKALSTIMRSACIAIVFAITVSCAFSSDNKIDESLLEGEHVVLFYQRIPSFASIAAMAYNPLNPEAVATEQNTLQKIAEQVFNVTEMQADMRRALTEVPAPAIDANDFSDASNAFAAEMIALNEEFAGYTEEDSRALDEEYKRTIASSPLEILAGVMGLHELGAEQVAVGRLMISAIDLYKRADSVRLREMGDAELRTFINQLIEDTWNMPSDEQPLEFRSENAAFFLKSSSALALSRLPPEQVSVLQKFYTSPEGRQKRQALVAAFKARVEADSREMLSEYFRGLRK